MTAPQRDLSALHRTVDFIAMHRANHNQMSWFAQADHVPDVTLPDGDTICGTTACVAGWHLLLNGYRHNGNGWSLDGGRRIESVSVHAGDLLGLTRDEAWVLFYAAMTWEDVEVVVKALDNGVDITTDHFWTTTPPNAE